MTPGIDTSGFSLDGNNQNSSYSNYFDATDYIKDEGIKQDVKQVQKNGSLNKTGTGGNMSATAFAIAGIVSAIASGTGTAIQHGNARRAQEKRFNQNLKLTKDKLRHQSKMDALSEIYRSRNWDWNQKKMAKSLAMMGQQQQAEAINSMKRSWQFNQTKKGQENRERVGKAFTRGILNAMSHSKK